MNPQISTSQTPDGPVSTVQVRFDGTEHATLIEYAVMVMYPRVFILVLQTAYFTMKAENSSQLQTPVWVEEGDIVGRTLWMGRGCEKMVADNFKEAWELGLLQRKETVIEGVRAGTQWCLTYDGKKFLMGALKMRMNLRKVSGMSDEHICEHLAETECEEWRTEAQDRIAILGRAALGEDGRPVRASGAGAAGYSRAALASNLARHTVKQAKNAQSQVSPFWAGLVRS